MADLDDDELLAALGVEIAPPKIVSHTPREERIIAGFEDILRFHRAHGRAPQHGEARDIFERLYAVRLDRLRQLPEALALLTALDTVGLLSSTTDTAMDAHTLDEDALLAELGVSADPANDDITVLRHVRSSIEKQAAEEIAVRTPCADFPNFKPLFAQVQKELDGAIRQTRSFQVKSVDEIKAGAFFIVGGQIAYIADVGDAFSTSFNMQRMDSRLRVIYDNGTESNVLLRSLQRALHRDDMARLITDPNPGPLFSQDWDEGDVESGTIYVLRSLSDHPYVAQHRELIHKIGVTGGKVESRIANACHDATYLLAEVEIVATYKLAGIQRGKLENLFHRIFAAAQLDLTIEDRFGHPVKPREWFLVPLQVIDEAVQRVIDGSITNLIYDPASATLIAVK
ncbi:MAG: GIY-YIG nuclease family protein [Dechloromonas sp.]|nr:GIY-YIG nuclease family protein [Dechloromonas sp.]